MAKAAKSSDKSDAIESIARNKRARHDYLIVDTFEAGLVLKGTEVKSLREGKANIGDAYGIIRNAEAYLLNLHISPYERGGYTNHEPDRTRKLLLHRKVALALGKGKKLHDKRETERARDAAREIARTVRVR
jgi:SsrA-binding protein